MIGDVRFQTVKLADIQELDNVRTDLTTEAIEDKARSIKSNGLLQLPLLMLRAGLLYVVAGATRVKALRLLGWTEFPALVTQSELSEAEITAIQLAENCARTPISAMDESMGILALQNAGMTGEQVAATMGKSASYVSRRLTLLTLPQPLQDAIRSEKLAPDIGVQLAKCEDPDEQARLGEEAMGGRLTRDQIARKLRRVANAEAATKTKAKRVTAKLPEGTSVSVCAPDLSLDKLIDVLSDALSQAKRARNQKLTLSTFVKTLADQSAVA